MINERTRVATKVQKKVENKKPIDPGKVDEAILVIRMALAGEGDKDINTTGGGAFQHKLSDGSELISSDYDLTHLETAASTAAAKLQSWGYPLLKTAKKLLKQAGMVQDESNLGTTKNLVRKFYPTHSPKRKK